MKKLFRPLVLGGVLLLAVGLAPVMDTTPARAATVTDANLKQMLEDLLREHPEIVLDVLRSHSEDVLDIAQAGANARRKAALEAQWHKEVKNTPQKQISLSGRPVKGNAAAPVRIVAFSDFTCHYCQQATHVLDEIMKKYGKNVSLVYKHMPLDEQGPGMLAARYFVAVAAQSESKAWKFYDAMYADRDRLLLEGQKFVDEVCDKLGLDKDRLKKDAASDKTARIIAQDLDEQRVALTGAFTVLDTLRYQHRRGLSRRNRCCAVPDSVLKKPVVGVIGYGIRLARHRLLRQYVSCPIAPGDRHRSPQVAFRVPGVADGHVLLYPVMEFLFHSAGYPAGRKHILHLL